jgi:hypothetical protein
MKKKRTKPEPPSETDLKNAYKLYLSKEFTLKQITRSTKISAYWIYKHHKKKLIQAQFMQITLFNE